VRALLALLLPLTLAAEGDHGITLDGEVPAEAAGLLHHLSGGDYRLDHDLVGSDHPVHLRLVDADEAAIRQAFACATGSWWLPDPHPLFTRADRLPGRGNLESGVYSTRLRDRRDLVPVVRGLVDPWLGAEHAGLDYLPANGTWAVTTDSAGQAQVAAILGLLEHGQPQVPGLLPPAPAIPDARWAEPVVGEGWPALLLDLGRKAGISIAVAPALVRDDDGMARSLRAAHLPAAVDELGEAGVAMSFHEGVLCCGPECPGPGLHPARRRLLAMVPVQHLAADDETGSLLAEVLRREAAPRWWDQPGAGLVWVDHHRALLIAADGAAMRAVLARIDHYDQHPEELGE